MRCNFLLCLVLFLPTVAFCQENKPDDLDLPVVAPVYAAGPAPIVPLPPPTTESLPTWPAPTFYGEEIFSEKGTVIFVIDRSGSMWEGNDVSYIPAPANPEDPSPPPTTGKRIDKAKAELVRAIRGLPPTWRFDVVEFTSANATVLWPHNTGSYEGMREATDENKSIAVAWVSKLSKGGDTPTFQGVKAALEFHCNDYVVLLTDGFPWSWNPLSSVGWMPNLHGPGMKNMSSGVTKDGSAIWSTTICHEYLIDWFNHSQRPTPARIDVFGIEASHGQYEWFCQQVAEHNNGHFILVD